MGNKENLLIRIPDGERQIVVTAEADCVVARCNRPDMCANDILMTNRFIPDSGALCRLNTGYYRLSPECGMNPRAVALDNK